MLGRLPTSLLWLCAIWLNSIAAAQLLGLELGLNLGNSDGLPTLTLPYGTYRAARHDANADMYTFKNIRFAAPPTGNNRWRKPQPPMANSTIQDGSHGPYCVQGPIPSLNLLFPGNESPAGGFLNQVFGQVDAPLFVSGAEDCLFLDLYVPGSAIRDSSASSLAVVVWIYGGAYTFGSKDQFETIGLYDGTGIVEQSGGNVIFVAGNYRNGAYGWLAGETMERDGLPNAALWDQRAVFQWVRDYIGLVGGDKDNVSAWGESAGAASIFHHLVAQGGTLDPMFHKAVTQSTFFELKWDRRGYLEDIFQDFAALAGCSGGDMNCLRAADPAALEQANTALIKNSVDGTFVLGPAADGDYIRQLAVLEYASGNYWKDIESLIVSHVADEAELFVDGHISTDQAFNNFVDAIYPPYAQDCGITAAIRSFYPPIANISTYASETDRTKAFVRDTFVTCNSRYQTSAFKGRTWNLQYSVTPGVHATDLIPTFYQLCLDLDKNSSLPLVPAFGEFAKTYQSYLTSHARVGDPNAFSDGSLAVQWPHPDTSSEHVENVMDAGDLGFSLITDDQLPKSHCDFVQRLAAAVTNLGGYAVPGTVQEQDLVFFSGDASATYIGMA